MKHERIAPISIASALTRGGQASRWEIAGGLLFFAAVFGLAVWS